MGQSLIAGVRGWSVGEEKKKPVSGDSASEEL